MDLVLTDPPYGIGIADWDGAIPPPEYFSEIFRISKNQVIFGGNYFGLPHTEGWICWDKTYRYAQKWNIGEFELAWTSFDIKATFIRYTCCGNFRGMNEKVGADYSKKPNLHPTQKPDELFVKILKDYTSEDALVFDPFLGSGTTCVAAKMLGRSYIGIDISDEYCQIARERLRAVDTGVPVKEARAGQIGLFGG